MHTILLTTWSLKVCKVNIQDKVIIQRENASTSLYSQQWEYLLSKQHPEVFAHLAVVQESVS